MTSWNRYKDFLENLWEMKYFVLQVLLNTQDFCVPQSRKRLFLLCSLSGKASEPTIIQKPLQPVSIVIDTSEKYNFTPLFKKGRADRTIESAERAIAKLGIKEKFLLVYYGSGRKGTGGWQTIDQPLGTITTLDRFAYVIPGTNGSLMRMLQPEELKLAMGFKEFQIRKC